MDTRMATAHDLARRSLRLMERWDDDEAAAIIHPDATNDEASGNPVGARVDSPPEAAARPRSRRPTTGCTPPSTGCAGRCRSWWPRATWSSSAP